jgi:hypothetical protein
MCLIQCPFSNPRRLFGEQGLPSCPWLQDQIFQRGSSHSIAWHQDGPYRWPGLRWALACLRSMRSIGLLRFTTMCTIRLIKPSLLWRNIVGKRLCEQLLQNCKMIRDKLLELLWQEKGLFFSDHGYCTVDGYPSTREYHRYGFSRGEYIRK